jgi:hypothetical protein
MNKAINTCFRARRSRFDRFMTQKYINFLLIRKNFVSRLD